MTRIAMTLDRLEELRRCLATITELDMDELWEAVREFLALLDEEAERQGGPFRQVRAKTTSLRHHFGILLRQQDWDGHPATQHLAWVMGDLQALRSIHCLGRALTAEAATVGASDTMH